MSTFGPVLNVFFYPGRETTFGLPAFSGLFRFSEATNDTAVTAVTKTYLPAYIKPHRHTAVVNLNVCRCRL